MLLNAVKLTFATAFWMFLYSEYVGDMRYFWSRTTRKKTREKTIASHSANMWCVVNLNQGIGPAALDIGLKRSSRRVNSPKYFKDFVVPKANG